MTSARIIPAAHWASASQEPSELMGRVCVVGSCMMDLITNSERLPAPGETVLGTSFETVVGGKGFNQAVAAARTGAQTLFVGRIGADPFGEAFTEAFAAEGIDAAFVDVDAAAGTGVGLPRVDSRGENSIVVVPRANWAVTPADVERAADAIASADVVLLQLELPLDAVAAAARIARRAGSLVILNPAPASVGAAEVAGLADIIVPNEAEARLLAGSTSLAPADLAAAVESTSNSKCIVTLAGAGVFVDGAVVPAHPVECVDTVGAGDAFCGALAGKLAAGDSLADAVRFANAAGALAVTRPGGAPAMPTREEVDYLLGASGTGPKATAAMSSSSTRLQ